MVAIDPKKTLDAYRAKRGEFRIVEVPPLQYLMIDGAGDPNTSPAYRDAVSALFPVAYALQHDDAPFFLLVATLLLLGIVIRTGATGFLK